MGDPLGPINLMDFVVFLNVILGFEETEGRTQRLKAFWPIEHSKKILRTRLYNSVIHQQARPRNSHVFLATLHVVFWGTSYYFHVAEQENEAPLGSASYSRAFKRQCKQEPPGDLSSGRLGVSQPRDGEPEILRFSQAPGDADAASVGTTPCMDVYSSCNSGSDCLSMKPCSREKSWLLLAGSPSLEIRRSSSEQHLISLFVLCSVFMLVGLFLNLEIHYLSLAAHLNSLKDQITCMCLSYIFIAYLYAIFSCTYIYI